MNISLNWLQERLDLGSRSLSEISDLLTFAGIEVEGLQSIGVPSPKIVVAQIKEAVQHPDADKLKVTQVDAGEGELRQIVCGAKNYQVGDKVPCCLPGADLGGFVIGETKMRGVESKGMLAAGSEIGLSDKEDGLLILDGDPAPGTPLQELFPSDTLIEVEVTPNRPDLLSHSGLARELAALLGSAVKPLERAPSELPATREAGSEITLASETCPFYSLVKISGVKVGPSPEWLARKLTAIGLRPINNIVDITNYVLHETGQPLHTFDAAKIQGPLHIRAARAGEKFPALDEATYALEAGDCLISDEAGQPLALGGIMGGLDSGVTEGTSDVLLESAWFQPSAIRATSRRLALHSDSSYRFERRVDPAQVLPASALATRLILELAGGEAAVETLTAGQVPAALPDVTLDTARLDQLLDGSIPLPEAEAILTSLGLRKKDGDNWAIPSFRGDLTRSADLIEEVARVHVLEKVPSRTDGIAVDESPADLAYDRLMVLKRKLAALGFLEAQTIKLIAENQLPDCLPLRPLMEGDLIRVARPLSEDHAVLRPSLTAGLIQSAARNLRQGQKSLRLFEAGRFFRNAGGGKAKDLEADSLALFLGGRKNAPSWAESGDSQLDLFDLKAVISQLVPKARLQFAPRARDGFLLAGDIQADGKVIGTYAQLLPSRARAIDLDAPAYLAELDLAKVLPLVADATAFHIEPLPQFPGSSRDIAMELPDQTSNAEIEKALAKHQEPLLVSASCFDHFRDPSGEKLAADKKSVAYTFTYRSAQKTLKAKEVDAAHEKLRAHLAKTLPLTFR
ncbi:MAG: phenylalanine--tRNA ligase subunit beta [Verrucomicrobiales bacterium]